jgi:hypothetical protein
LNFFKQPRFWEDIVPGIIAILCLLAGGVFLLHRADQQARDTIRKHHLADVEQSLYYARRLHGTYPPYDQTSWCGPLAAAGTARDQIEEALRAQNDMYKNQAKPFPVDPKFANTPKDYFYWKHSPASFELFAVLEQDPNGEKSTFGCPNESVRTFDYGLTSVFREQ